VEALENKMSSTAAEHGKEFMNHNNVEEAWQEISSATTAATQSCFTERKKSEEWIDLKKQRLRLLNERAGLRTHLDEEGDLDLVKLELALVARRLGQLRRHHRRAQDDQRLEEQQEAWGKRQFCTTPPHTKTTLTERAWTQAAILLGATTFHC
jgi:hypothetical protein